MLTLDTYDLVIRDWQGKEIDPWEGRRDRYPFAGISLVRRVGTIRPGPWEIELPCGFCHNGVGRSFVSWAEKPDRFIRLYSDTAICEDCEAKVKD